MTPKQRRPRSPSAKTWTLVGGAVAVVASGCNSPRPNPPEQPTNVSSTTIPTTTAPATTAPATTVAKTAQQRDLDVLKEFVEKTMGRPFKAEPAVNLLADAAFQNKLTELFRKDAAELKAIEATLRALGLIDLRRSLQEQLESLLADSVLGVYDDDSKNLYVRGDVLTAGTKSTVVHELAHLWQDQHHGIDRELDDDVNEAQSGFTALIEGHAEFVRTEYEKQLSSKEQGDIRRESLSRASTGSERISPFLIRLLMFPYTAGLEFVEHVDSTSGRSGIDAAYVKPPITTEAILHPDQYLAGKVNEAVPKPVPPAGAAAVLDDGVLGEAFLWHLLALKVSSLDGRRAAEGWGGDSYSSYKKDGADCVTAHIVMDPGPHKDEMLSTLRAWDKKSKDVVVQELGRTLEFVSCTKSA